MDLIIRAFYRNSNLFIRITVVASLLLMVAVMTQVASERQMEAGLLLVAGLGGAIALIRRPALGLIAVAVAGMVVPALAGPDLNISMVLVAGLLCLWLLTILVNRTNGESAFISIRATRLIVAFIVVSLIAFGIGQVPWFVFAPQAPIDAQVAGLMMFLLSAGAFLLVAHQMNDIRDLRWMTWAFVAAGGLFVFGRVFPPAGILIRAIFQNQAMGGVFWAWLPAMALSQAIYNHRLHPGIRAILALIVLGTLYYGIGVRFDWKSGWVPPLVAVAVILALRSWRLGLLMLLIGAYPAWRLAADALVSDSYSVSTRLDAWIILSEIVKVNPFLGLGFANYYWYTPLFPIRGFAVKFNSHNNYVDIVAQTGLIGLMVICWFFVEIGRLGWRLRDQVPEGFEKAYVYGALGGLAGTLAAAMLGDWVLSFVYNIGLSGFRTGVHAWLFLGGLVVLHKFYGDRANGTG